jgi:hypothetical protein
VRPGFARGRVRLTSDAITRAKLAAAINALCDAPALPEPGDVAGLLPPGLHVHVRRASGLALWIWYTADDTKVTLHALTDAPP